MKVVSPTALPLGSVKARARQVPVGTAELSGNGHGCGRRRPGRAARRGGYSTPSGRSITRVSGAPVMALPCPSRSSAVRYTVSLER